MLCTIAHHMLLSRSRTSRADDGDKSEPITQQPASLLGKRVRWVIADNLFSSRDLVVEASPRLNSRHDDIKSDQHAAVRKSDISLSGDLVEADFVRDDWSPDPAGEWVTEMSDSSTKSNPLIGILYSACQRWHDTRDSDDAQKIRSEIESQAMQALLATLGPAACDERDAKSTVILRPQDLEDRNNLMMYAKALDAFDRFVFAAGKSGQLFIVGLSESIARDQSNPQKLHLWSKLMECISLVEWSAGSRGVAGMAIYTIDTCKRRSVHDAHGGGGVARDSTVGPRSDQEAIPKQYLESNRLLVLDGRAAPVIVVTPGPDDAGRRLVVLTSQPDIDQMQEYAELGGYEPFEAGPEDGSFWVPEKLLDS